jgi:sulfite exporter TauE/SafE
MIELPLVLVAGAIGSSHCIGMCGPLALAVGSRTPGLISNLARQSVYTAGRVFTYAVLGAAVGFGGWRLTESLPPVVHAPALLAIVAGALLVYQGLLATGWVPRRVGSSTMPCLASTFLATFLTAPGLLNAFLAGLFTGLLPCGLLYAFLTLAASSRSLTYAAVLMIAFGLGTAPVMIATGCGASVISLASRRRVYRFAAWCVVLTGIVSIVRGAGYVCVPGWFEPAGCPLCW